MPLDRTVFSKGWARAKPRMLAPNVWEMSPGFLKLTRALENAMENGDVSQREAGMLIEHISFAFAMEDAKRLNTHAQQHEDRRVAEAAQTPAKKARPSKKAPERKAS